MSVHMRTFSKSLPHLGLSFLKVNMKEQREISVQFLQALTCCWKTPKKAMEVIFSLAKTSSMQKVQSQCHVGRSKVVSRQTLSTTLVPLYHLRSSGYIQLRIWWLAIALKLLVFCPSSGTEPPPKGKHPRTAAKLQVPYCSIFHVQDSMEWLVDITSSNGLNLKPPPQVHVLNACSLLLTLL